MHVTKGWEECTLEIADMVEKNLEMISKLCEGGRGVNKILSRH